MSVSACPRRPAGGTGRRATFLNTSAQSDGVALHRLHTVAAEAGWLRRARALRCYYVRHTYDMCYAPDETAKHQINMHCMTGTTTESTAIVTNTNQVCA